MTPAAWPRANGSHARLLRVDPGSGSLVDQRIADLPNLLRRGDLLVVNDAATLPADLVGATAAGPVEVRLAGQGETEVEWNAVLFGAGTWRQRTEDRGPAPVLAAGEWIDFAGGLRARVQSVSPVAPRLVLLRFDRTHAALWTALYRAGRRIQYAYVCGPLVLWHVQNAWAARPWAVEMPSAGRSLEATMLGDLGRRGIRVASLTHAAGLSSTGDVRLDSLLPLPERFEIPAPTLDAIDQARGRGGRIVAVGTTVVRALEGCAARHDGELRAGRGRTDLRIGPGFVPRIVQGVLSGLHEPGTSHFELLTAFAPRPLLEAAYRHAESAGYLAHEFGDSSLVLAA